MRSWAWLALAPAAAKLLHTLATSDAAWVYHFDGTVRGQDRYTRPADLLLLALMTLPLLVLLAGTVVRGLLQSPSFFQGGKALSARQAGLAASLIQAILTAALYVVAFHP